MSKARPLDEVLADAMQDPEFRAECERNAVADAVSVWLVAYRAEHGLSQRALAALVGMKQTAIARLERGDVEPRLSTLVRLAEALGTPLQVTLSPAERGVSGPAVQVDVASAAA